MGDAKKQAKCSNCGVPVEGLKKNPTFPFCSPRCKRVDLGRWLGEDYTISREPNVMDLLEMDEKDLKALNLDEYIA